MTDTASCGPALPPAHSRQRTDIDEYIGKILKMRRQMVGFTQAELADESGLSPQQIHKYESGRSRMTAGRLVEMASILQMPVSFFFDDIEDHPDAPNDLLEMLSDPNSLEVMMTLSTVTDVSERRRIVDLIRVIVNHEITRLSGIAETDPPVSYLPDYQNARS